MSHPGSGRSPTTPRCPSPRLSVGLLGARICQFRPIEERSIALGAVAEPIDPQEVDNLVLPGMRGRVIGPAGPTNRAPRARLGGELPGCPLRSPSEIPFAVFAKDQSLQARHQTQV